MLCRYAEGELVELETLSELGVYGGSGLDPFPHLFILQSKTHPVVTLRMVHVTNMTPRE